MKRSRCGAFVGWLLAGSWSVVAAAQPGSEDGSEPAATAAAQPADPEAWEAARALFERGTLLMQNENWELAAVELQRSFERYPTRSALFNLAMCKKALHQYRAALAHFDEWQRRFAEAAAEEEREAVAAAQQELRQDVGFVVVESDPPGATVRVDGEEAGTTPFAQPLVVDIGRHALDVSLAGFRASSQDVLVAPLDTVRLSLVLTPEPEETVGSGPVGKAGEEEGGDQAWFWTAAAAAVAAGIGGGVAGGMVLSQEDDLAGWRDRCAAGDRAACDDGRAALGDYDDARLAANVLLGTAGAFAATALVLAFFTDFDFGGEEPPPVELTAGPAGLGASGAPGGFAVGFGARF